MSEDVFTEPTEPSEAWADVCMTDPEAGEWDVDAVIAGGRVEFVDLRIQPALLEGFVDCLLDDVSDERASAVLQSVAERQGVDLGEE